MNLVLFGPPGSGKGTQSERVVKQYSLTHISTGDALRTAIRNKTAVGLKAREVIERGELVSDELVTEMLREIIRPLRDTTDSFLFDGYPRTTPQVEQLANLCEEFSLSHPAVINLHVPEETLILRLTGRRICADCKATYNIYFKPTRQAGVCDECSGPLTKRVDDNPETTRERLRVYHEQSAPVLRIYGEQGVLYTIDATGSTDDVAKKISRIIEENY
ncbi:MAG TPA: adenylate kinase [Candidatus Sumerlaeota bacterium]|nr:adenylate kinase [Candidatus Sumerlaeota bacterium]HMX62960.1 adenylate kinase [Candidatus Sumerlaeota bacterium]HNM46986.1 adenylate kinase [Candidatus Sumerlaeota bacterium]